MHEPSATVCSSILQRRGGCLLWSGLDIYHLLSNCSASPLSNINFPTIANTHHRTAGVTIMHFYCEGKSEANPPHRRQSGEVKVASEFPHLSLCRSLWPVTDTHDRPPALDPTFVGTQSNRGKQKMAIHVGTDSCGRLYGRRSRQRHKPVVVVKERARGHSCKLSLFQPQGQQSRSYEEVATGHRIEQAWRVHTAEAEST